MAKNKSKKAAPVEEIDDDEEDLELEELDEDVEDEAPAKSKKSKKSKADDGVTFGASDLAKLASDQGEKEYDAKTIRTLLRRMARDGRLTREISPDNRTRYNWSGPDDPEVVKILKAISKGEIETARKEALDKLKEGKAKTAKTGKAKKTAPPPDDDDDDLEDLEDE